MNCAEQGKRLALEQWLAASDQSHYRALTDEQTQQARLPDRLATADLGLSAQLDVTAAPGCDAVQSATGAGGVFPYDDPIHRRSTSRKKGKKYLGNICQAGLTYSCEREW